MQRRTSQSPEFVHIAQLQPGGSRQAVVAPDTPCGKKCCWTPYGHSNVRDSYRGDHKLACKCHGQPAAAPTEGNSHA